MIELLKKNLTECWGYDMSLSTEDLNLILHITEKLGMLPPSIRLNATNEFTTLNDLDILHDYDCSFAWMDEHEKI